MQTIGISKHKSRSIPTGLSLNSELFERVEQARGYEPRSQYISRILQASLSKEDATN